MRRIFFAYSTAAFCLAGTLVVAQPPGLQGADKQARNDDTSASLQWLLDKNYEWLSGVHSLSATVEVESAMGHPPVTSHFTGTLIVSGDKYKLTKTINRIGKGGKRDTFQETVVYNGDQYFEMDSSKRTAVVGSAPPGIAKLNPYGAFRMPFTDIYSWVQNVGTEMENSIPALKNPSLWKAEQYRVANIVDETTSNGLVKTVNFLWDHGAGQPSVRTSMAFPEQYGYKPESFKTMVRDEATSQFYLTGEGSVTNWTTVTLGFDKESVIVPVEKIIRGFNRAGQNRFRELLQADPKTLRFNDVIPDEVFALPPVPSDYKTINADTWETITTDPETLKNWNDSMRLKSCLECSETTAPEYLPTGNLSLEITLESMAKESLAGQRFRVFYRYGNCCVLFSSGTLAADERILLKDIPGAREHFEYAVYVEDTHVSTLEPTTSGSVTLQVAPVENQLAPDIQLTDMFTSETTALSNFRGQKLVVDFWGIDCAPCRPSLIRLNDYARSFGDSGRIVFLALTSKGQKAEPTINFFKDKQLDSLRSFWVSNEAFGYTGMDGIPLTLFFDENGRIVWRGNPGDDDFQKRLLDFIQN